MGTFAEYLLESLRLALTQIHRRLRIPIHVGWIERKLLQLRETRAVRLQRDADAIADRIRRMSDEQVREANTCWDRGLTKHQRDLGERLLDGRFASASADGGNPKPKS